MDFYVLVIGYITAKEPKTPRRMSCRRGTNRPTFHQQMRVVPRDAVEKRLAIFDAKAGGSADGEAEDSRL